ncbi:hypothetical protein QPK87_17670 [Kamptonema cortianum]|nr:hypothetical protein [Geitlerinema splendidum]MDK3158384.1 hypothetical protein [Kamptonema cortianum]
MTVKPGVVLESTSILLENGLISKIGANISAPDGAQVIEARGLNVYPGLIHGYLRATTTEPKDSNAPEQPTRQLSSDEQAAERMRARDKDPFGLENNLQSHKLMSAISGQKIDPFASLASHGYSYAHFTSTGGILGARSATFNLSNGNAESATIRANTQFIPVNLGARSFGSYPGSTMGTIAVIRQALADAQWCIASPDAEKIAGERVAALKGLFNGKARLVFDDLNEVSFYQAYKIAEEFKLKPLYVFRSDAARVAHLVKNQGSDIILRGTIPSKPSIGGDLSQASINNVRSYFNELQAGAELAKAGVKFGYAPSSTNNPLEGIRLYCRA